MGRFQRADHLLPPRGSRVIRFFYYSAQYHTNSSGSGRTWPQWRVPLAFCSHEPAEAARSKTRALLVARGQPSAATDGSLTELCGNLIRHGVQFLESLAVRLIE